LTVPESHDERGFAAKLSSRRGAVVAHSIQEQGKCTDLWSALQRPAVRWSTLERPSVPICGAGGSCWAFAASRVFSDRLYRASAGRWNIAISEQNLVSCNLVGAYVHRASSLIRCNR
jgi:hypothetical protein